ncbi:MAG: hypothetical protein ACR2MN_01165 [Acidimicrobiales bacterium]
MTSPFPTEPPSGATPVLTAEAAHARHILDVAAKGPESTRTIIPSLMRSLVDQGYRTSVSWYLAPSPGDDLHEVIFSVRTAGSDAPDLRRWRERREIAAVLEEAERLAEKDERVEVWSGNGHGLRRLVIAGGVGTPLRFMAPHLKSFAGEQSLAAAAVAAWQRVGGPEAITAVPAPIERTSANPATPDPSLGAPVVPPPVAPPVLADTDALVTALQEALGQVRVEVDLGAIEDLVADSLRSALAELPGTAFGLDAEWVAANLRPPVVSPDAEGLTATNPARTPTTDIEISAPYGVPAVAAEWPRSTTEGSRTFPREEFERLVDSSVASAVDTTLANRLPELSRRLARAIADRLPAPPPAGTPPAGAPAAEPTSWHVELQPELEDRLAGSVTSVLDGHLARQLPALIDRLEGSKGRAGSEPTRVEPDPIDVARRVAASVLSPSEIAETLLFRLRPLLDEHNERALHRESTEAEHDRLAVDQTRASLSRLEASMVQRLERLEGEVRRLAPAPAEPDTPGASVTLRVLRPDGSS